MRKVALTVLLLALILCVPARAEEGVDQVLETVDTQALDEWADQAETGLSAGELLRALAHGEGAWDLGTVGQALGDMALGQAREAITLLKGLIIPAILCAALTLIASRGMASAAGWVCYLAIAAQLVIVYGACAKVAATALERIGALTETLYPMLAALLAATGKPAGSAMFTPVAALTGGLVSSVIDRSAQVLGGIAASLTVAGSLSEHLPLEGLSKLARGAFTFVLSAALTVFTGLLSVQGLLARGYDSASVQTARFAIGSLIPVVGGEVADSLDALVSSAGLVRNAVGVTGLILLVGGCLKPILYLLACAACVRVAAVVVEPVGKSSAQKLLKEFAGVMAMLPAAVIAAAVLLIVLIGAALTVFGG